MTRESTEMKAARYLTTGALTVTAVDGDHIAATCQGDNGLYRVGHDAARPGFWWCTCPARVGQCAHVRALVLVVVSRVRATPPAELQRAS